MLTLDAGVVHPEQSVGLVAGLCMRGIWARFWNF